MAEFVTAGRVRLRDDAVEDIILILHFNADRCVDRLLIKQRRRTLANA